MSSTENPWALAVGTFVLAFGDIEHTAIALLGCLPECRIPKTAPNLDLRRRFDMLNEVLGRSNDEEYTAVLLALRRVEKLLEQRNLLAHNGVWFDIYKDGDRVVISQSLVSARNRAKRLTLKQVQELADKAREGAAEFSSTSVVLMKRYFDEDVD